MTLRKMQKYIKDIGVQRGWDRDSALEKFLLLTEEVGELAKEIRKASGLYTERGKKIKIELSLEMADVLNYLLDIANHYGIDLEKAFWEKERINKKRKWVKTKPKNVKRRSTKK